MVDNFERYIGDISLIKEVEELGLHHNLELELDKILDLNSKNIKILLRQLRLSELV